MALIKCPECGKEISDKAKVCPNCGYPISDEIPSGLVKIRIPVAQKIADGFVGLFASKDAVIKSFDKVSWKGKHGETARFELETPTKIKINMGSWANEVDVIDSER